MALNNTTFTSLTSRIGNKDDFRTIFRQSSSKDFCSELANKIWDFEIEGHKETFKKLVSPKDFYNRLKYYKYGRG